MKVDALKKILKEAVREVFQEELKEVLMEAVRSPKSQVVSESKPSVSPETRQSMRESYKQIIGETANTMGQTGYGGQPLQMKSTDTTSPNGSLPSGEVGLDSIMGMMKK